MITIRDISRAASVRERSETVHLGDFAALGLPLFPRCENCNTELTIEKAYPTTHGDVRCFTCTGRSGFSSVDAYNDFKQADNSKPQRNLS